MEHTIPGNLVFARQRLMRRLGPAEGVPGVPEVFIIPSATTCLAIDIPEQVVTVALAVA